MIADLRHGPWEAALADVATCHVVLTDPPYSARTHAGQRGAGAPLAGQVQIGALAAGVEYGALGPDDPPAFVASWAPRVRGWAIAFCDHVAFGWWEAAWQAVGWRTFAPVVWLPNQPGPRFAADGPACAAEWLCVARPPGWPRDRGSRPGLYGARTMHGEGRTGCKDPRALGAILGDYSRPGDLVVDPFAGTATVGAACIASGRDYIGAEVAADVHAMGAARLRRVTPPLPGFEVDRWAS